MEADIFWDEQSNSAKDHPEGLPYDNARPDAALQRLPRKVMDSNNYKQLLLWVLCTKTNGSGEDC